MERVEVVATNKLVDEDVVGVVVVETDDVLNCVVARSVFTELGEGTMVSSSGAVIVRMSLRDVIAPSV
jgi:hypothetical protein